MGVSKDKEKMLCIKAKDNLDKIMKWLWMERAKFSFRGVDGWVDIYPHYIEGHFSYPYVVRRENFADGWPFFKESLMDEQQVRNILWACRSNINKGCYRVGPSYIL